MIITRTPFRVSLAGGGSDIREFYSKNGYGAVISAAIKKYMYVVIHPYFHDKIRIKYSKTEDVESVDEIQHSIVRECLRKVKVGRGIEIASFADVAAGTGLGSSSAFTVGLLHALYTHKGRVVSKEKLAREACEIEINILGEPIGKQDQYSTAYGDLNYIRFNKDEGVVVSPIQLKEITQKKLCERLYLYYLGGERKAADILREQKNNMQVAEKFQKLKRIVLLADELKEILEKEDIDEVGNMLHQGWLHKKELASGISNENIDNTYDEFIKHGASGGKLLGAGGCGFLLIYTRDHSALKKDLNYKVMPFSIDREGTKIIFRNR